MKVDGTILRLVLFLSLSLSLSFEAVATSRVTDGCTPGLTELNDYTSGKVKEEADAFDSGRFRKGEIQLASSEVQS